MHRAEIVEQSAGPATHGVLTPAVSVVIPAYNEQDAVAATIDTVRETLSAAGISHEIIVVNDGSTDDTLGSGARETGVQVVNFPHNGGYGRALKAGIAVSTGPLVAILGCRWNVSRRHTLPEMIAMMRPTMIWSSVIEGRP